jgi:hypothetical protein
LVYTLERNNNTKDSTIPPYSRIRTLLSPRPIPLTPTPKLKPLNAIHTNAASTPRLLLLVSLTLTLFLLLLLLDLTDRFLGQFLAIHAFEHVLLPGALVAKPDEQAGCGIARDGADEDDRGDGEGAVLVVDTPGTGAEGDLEQGVAVEQDDDGDEEA